MRWLRPNLLCHFSTKYMTNSRSNKDKDEGRVCKPRKKGTLEVGLKEMRGEGRSKRSSNSYYTKHVVDSISLVGFFQVLNILDLVGV